MNTQLLTVIFLIMVTFTVSETSAGDAKIAPYTALLSDGHFELRQYPSLVLVSVPATHSERNLAFRKLFSYISGQNSDKKKIAMTTPVFMNYSEDEMNRMAFVMPQSMALASTPLADDSSVSVLETEAMTYATVRFNGRMTQKRIKKYKQRLLEWISQKGWKRLNEIKTAGYNAPSTLPVFRRNEILIAVEAPESLQ